MAGLKTGTFSNLYESDMLPAAAPWWTDGLLWTRKMCWDEWKALMVRALMRLGAMRSEADHPKTL